MNQYAFLFRKGPKELSEEQQKQRAEEVSAWARRQIDEGRKLGPHMLGNENHRISPADGAPQSAGEWPVIAIVFLEARDLAEAAAIAKTHPGLRYGVSVEVRPWAPPTPPR
ncbi:MAG: hypothetical protein HYX27_22415 [Acidobacteria bacterium]|nr:hypothetical protein [Acidobacteriota bacterium]